MTIHLCRTDDCFHITLRDQEMLEMLIAGMPDKDVAARFGLTTRTVKNRFASLRIPTGGHGCNRIEFAWAARRLLHPDWNDPTWGIHGRMAKEWTERKFYERGVQRGSIRLTGERKPA